uniref:Protein kinase domain-containing protein n=1 Tax=Globisporangium ultimum (strain ATCC 200006 / CBS 805.95 / DAOM BR144) TaxID=431595 RepID=K3WQK0_GLOUD
MASRSTHSFSAVQVNARLTSEFTSNGNLREYLARHNDDHLAWKMLYELSLAVQYLHTRNVIHNDLRCNNVLVDGDGKAKLTERTATEVSRKILAPQLHTSPTADRARAILSYAAEIGDWKMCTFLVEPASGNAEIVQLLLDRGADINEKDNYGRSPLSFASEAGYFRVTTRTQTEELHCRRWYPLSHPHVRKLFGACHIEAQPFFVYEYGKQLKKFVETSNDLALAAHDTHIEPSDYASIDTYRFPQLDFDTIPVKLDRIRGRCQQLPASKWLIRDDGVTANATINLDRYLRTTLSEESIALATRSRQVAESHHVIYEELDRLLDMVDFMGYEGDQGTISNDLFLHELYEVALGLAYMHGMNVVHNDLKCDNVLVGMDEKAKLIDFGLSAIVNDAEITVNARRMGAVHWKSPEYLAGGRPTFASDVYSFAMCILEAVTGDIPWGSTMHSVAVKFHVKKGTIPTRPEMMNDKQWNLIELMTKQNPSQRCRGCASVPILTEEHTELGESVNEKDASGETALLAAARTNSSKSLYDLAHL